MASLRSTTAQRILHVTRTIQWVDSAYLPDNMANLVRLPLVGGNAPFGGEGSGAYRGQSYDPGVHLRR
jgi:hypothetical protein